MSISSKHMSSVAPTVSVEILLPDNSIIVRGNSVDITCEVINGTSPVTLRWVPAIPTLNFNSMLITSVTLDGSNYGNLTCIGSNAYGNDSAFVTLIEAGEETEYSSKFSCNIHT